MQANLTVANRYLIQLAGLFKLLPVLTALLVAGIAAGLLTASQPLMVTGVIVAGLLALLITVTRPDWALLLYFCGVLFLTDSAPSKIVDCFYIADPDIIEGLPSLLTTFFFLMLGITAARMMVMERRYPPVSLLPLGLYTVVLGFALMAGLYRDNTFDLIHTDFLGLLFPVLCFYLCMVILNSRERITRLLIALFAVASVKASILAAYYLAGRGWIYQLDSNAAYRITTMDSADLLVFITLLLVAAHLIVRGDLRGFSAGLTAVACIPLLYVVVFCYRRAQWVGLIFSLGLLYLGASKAVRKKTVLLLFAVLLLGGAFAVTAGLSADKAQRITARLGSIFDKKQSSNVYHVLESEQVLKDLSRSPLFGLGLGGKHSPLGLYEEDEVPTNVVHNTFLYIWMKLGLPGLVFFLWCAGLFFRKILRFRKTHIDSAEWGLVLPLAASAGLWLATFLTGPVPWYLHQTGLIALFAAITVSLILNAGKERQEAVQ